MKSKDKAMGETLSGVQNVKGTNHLRDLDIDERIILKCIFKTFV
jgi:hypothetical protein